MPLSPQEKKLFFYLITKARVKEIANCMKLSDSAIDTYARNIYKKLDCESRLDLIIRYHSKEKSLAERLILMGI